MTDCNKTVTRIGIVNEFLFNTIGDASEFIGDNFLNIKSIGDPTEVVRRFTVKNPLPI